MMEVQGLGALIITVFYNMYKIAELWADRYISESLLRI